MTTPRDLLDTAAQFSRNRWAWALGLVAVPCLVSLAFLSWDKNVTLAQQRQVCLSFVEGNPGWRTQDVTLQAAQALEPDARGAFTVQLAQALEGLQRPAPAERLRLFALPAWSKASYFHPQHLVGPEIQLSGPAHHAPPGSGLLFIDLPWVGGTYEAMNVTGPCGTYRQSFELLLTSYNRGTLTVQTRQAGQVVARWQLAVQR